MKNAGYKSLIRTLAALPGTAEQVQRATPEIALTTIVERLRSLERTGLCHIERVEHVGSRMFVRHYAAGPGKSAHWPYRSKDGGRSQATAHGLAALREMMAAAPTSVTELVEETGIHRRVVHWVLRNLRQYGLARIAGWERTYHNNPYPLWAWGGGTDAKKPKPTPRREQNARAYLRRRERNEHLRLIAATAGRDGCRPMVAPMVASERRAA